MKSIQRILTCFSLLAISVSSSYAQTHVAGYVSGVWTVEGSPYIADSTIVIHQDSLLVIEPGVVVNISGGIADQDSMKVCGDLHAWGTETDTILIDCSQYGVLYFAPTALYDIRLEYCKMVYPWYSPWVRDIPITFSHCYFDGVIGVGFFVEDSPIVVFDSCYANGYMRTNYCTCEMRYNCFDGFVNCYSTTLTAFDNEFNDGLDVQGGGEVRSNYLGGSLHLAYNVHIINNIIYGNIYTASFSDTIEYNEIHGKIDLYAGVPVIRNNLIINPSGCISCDASPQIVNNTLIFGSEVGTSGAISVGTNHTAHIKNNIMMGDWYNCGAVSCGTSASAEISYNTLWRMEEPYYVNCSPTVGDTFTDPRFYDFEEGDYDLLPDSPCIDTADPASPPDPDHTPADRGYAYYDHRIDHPPAVDSPTSSFAQRGAEFSYTATALDDGDFLDISFLDLPDWLDPIILDLIYDSVTVSGEVPPEQGDFTFTIIAEDGIGQADTESVQVEVTDFTILCDTTTGVLTAAASPYLMVDNIIIPYGDSLRIEPGCILKAKYYEYTDYRSHIYVYGRLTAEGTEEDSIIFTSEREEWESFDWFGIWFYGCNEDTSKIAYSLIEAAKRGIFADSSSNLTVYNNSFINDRGGIYLQNSSNIRIAENYFQLIENYEIKCNNSNSEIFNNYFDNPSTYAPTIYLLYSDAYIHNNIFDACWYITVDMFSHPMIINNLFTNIDFYAICVSNESYPSIYNNTISSCIGGIILSNGNLVMKNNIIANCTEGGLNSSYGFVPDTVMNNNIWCPGASNYINCPDSLGLLVTVNANGDSCDIYGNISMDPLFEGGTPFSYYLQTESPCIDAGIDVGFPYFGLAPDMGAYEFDPSAVNPSNTELFPQTVHLYQNYPNPFNRSTTIQFDLAYPTKVTLIITNILGEEMMELCDDYLTSGRYTFQWNSQGGSSGVYFIVFNAGDYRKVIKCVCVK